MDKPQTKILYVITKSNWGGAQRYVYDLALAAQKRGHEVVVASGEGGDLLERLTSSGVRTQYIKAYRRDVHFSSEWAAFRELYALMREERPDIVHANSSKAGIALLAARLSGVHRTVFTVHGWAWNENRSWYQKLLMWFLYYITLILSQRIIFVSRAARSQAHFPLLSRRMHVVWNGIGPISFLSREEARTKLLPGVHKHFWVGTIAELHPVKGLPVLIEAYEHVAPDVPDSELVIIGEGEMRQTLERQLMIEGVSRTSCLLGHIPDASKYLKAFDVFVLPSRSEGLPYVLLEAGMAERAVVATAVGGIPEVIQSGKTGLLVPYGDRGALTEAITRLAQDSGKRESYAKALQERIHQDFSLEQMVEKTLSLY